MGIQIAVEFGTECDGKDAVHRRGILIFMGDVPVFVAAPEMVVNQKKVLSILYGHEPMPKASAYVRL